MAGLNLYSGDDFCVQVSFDAGTTWRELFSTAWEEAEEAAPITQVTALYGRSGSVVGTKPLPTVTLGMEAANLTDPTFNRLAQIGSDTNVQFRVASAAQVLKTAASSNDTLAIAATTGIGTWGGTSAGFTDATFGADDQYVQGIVAEIGSDLDGTDPMAVLAEKDDDDSRWFMPASGNVETSLGRTIPTDIGAAISAGRYRLLKPGAARPGFNAKVTLGGAITLRTGEQAASSFELAPIARLPAIKAWLSADLPGRTASV